MKIVTYASSLTDAAPDAYRCVARIVLDNGTRHPVIFEGPDKPTVRAKAEAWWADEIAKVPKAARERKAPKKPKGGQPEAVAA